MLAKNTLSSSGRSGNGGPTIGEHRSSIPSYLGDVSDGSGADLAVESGAGFMRNEMQDSVRRAEVEKL